MTRGAIAIAIEAAESTPLKPGHGLLTYPDNTGDIKQTWDRTNSDEVEAARRLFNDLKSKGYQAFRVSEDGQPGGQMNEFDPSAERVTLIPSLVGG